MVNVNGLRALSEIGVTEQGPKHRPDETLRLGTVAGL